MLVLVTVVKVVMVKVLIEIPGPDCAPYFICFLSFNPPLEVANIIICHYLQFEARMLRLRVQ